MDAKENILYRLNNTLKGLAMYVKDDSMISNKEKCLQLDILLNVSKFLKDYDKNVELLKLNEKEKEESR